MSGCHIGNLGLGRVPRVVGSVTRAETLPACKDRSDFDIAEIRLDQFESGQESWKDAASQLQESGTPCLLTIRRSEEGGAWTGGERKRASLFLAHLDFVSAIDLELDSEVLAELVAAAHEKGRVVIGSFHDFSQTPDLQALQEMREKARDRGVDVLKVATTIQSLDDQIRLMQLLKSRGEFPLCVVGMGPLGRSSRFHFPCVGSCLAYGYVDAPSAPGQPHCRRLTEFLRENYPEYNKDQVARKQLLECV